MEIALFVLTLVGTAAGIGQLYYSRLQTKAAKQAEEEAKRITEVARTMIAAAAAASPAEAKKDSPAAEPSVAIRPPTPEEIARFGSGSLPTGGRRGGRSGIAIKYYSKVPTEITIRVTALGIINVIAWVWVLWLISQNRLQVLIDVFESFLK